MKKITTFKNWVKAGNDNAKASDINRARISKVGDDNEFNKRKREILDKISKNGK